MKSIKVLEGQSLMDIAIRYYGSTSGIIYLIEDNALLRGFNHKPAAGDVLNIRETDLSNAQKAIVDYFDKKNRFPATQSEVTLSEDNGYVDDYVDEGYVSVSDTAILSELDLIHYYEELLYKLDLLDDIVAGRNIAIVCEMDTGETETSFYADVDHKGTYTGVSLYNVETDAYTISINGTEMTLPFTIDEGDEIIITVEPTDELEKTQITISGSY